MKRRSFFKTAALGSGALALSPVISCTPLAPADKAPDQPIPSFDLDEITIDLLQEKMAAGEMTSLEIVEKYLTRIAEIDTSGPMLNSVIELNPDAREIAQQLDLERKDGRVRGPLHGIPILIKDNIDTGDSMQTTAGSLAMAGFYAQQDAFIVMKLREAGAVILGKTNLSEWANIRSTRSSSGWSGRGGQALNPYMLNRTPCGSSSGSGVAVAANLCAAAIGTETDGSVKSLKDIIDFNMANAEKEMPWFGQEIFLQAQEKGGLQEKEYQDALALSKELSQRAIDTAIEQNNLDCLVAPTNGPAWTIDWVNGDHFVSGSSDLAAVSGYPNITVPAGFVHHLPIGISFIGKAWDEPALLKIAYGFEQAGKARRKPEFMKSLM
jgi:Asp-tRNA(Asn)/Glu-tRNA(Gln) amidotransferase A subunit family amidase